MEHVLFRAEVDLITELCVDLLLEFILELLCGFHTVLGRTEDTTDTTLLLLSELGHLPLLQDTLDQSCRRRYVRVLL